MNTNYLSLMKTKTLLKCMKNLVFIFVLLSLAKCDYNIDKYYDSLSADISPGRINNSDNKMKIYVNISEFSTKELNSQTIVKVTFTGDFTPLQFSLENSEVDHVSSFNFRRVTRCLTFKRIKNQLLLC